MKKKEILLLGILISAVLVVNGWSLFKASKGQSQPEMDFIEPPSGIVPVNRKTETVLKEDSFWLNIPIMRLWLFSQTNSRG